MPSDRDLAQQWLAERVREGMSGPTQLYCDHPDWGGPACQYCLAAAILDTPGVEVGHQYGGPTGTAIGTKRIVIRFPVEPISPAAQHQDRTEREGS